MKVTLYSDGSARPTNPGPAGIGAVGYDGDGARVVEISRHIGRSSNNVAEYMAAIAAVKAAVDLGASHVLLRTDSTLVVEQFADRWKCRNESLIPLLFRLRGLSKRFETFEIEWVPREKNREADGLSVAGAYPGAGS